MTKKPALTAHRVSQSLYYEGSVFDGLDSGVACDLVDWTIDYVIAALRRDPRFAAVPIAELELILADVRRESVDDIAVNILELVTVDDVRDLAKRGFPIDEDGGSV